MVTRKLNDYRYNPDTGEIVYIYQAKQPDDYDPRLHCIRYQIKSNKPRKIYEISSKDKHFWSKYKRIPKVKAMLLW
jgi:hypothetical protein